MPQIIKGILVILVLFVNCTTKKNDYQCSDEMCVIFKEDPNDKDTPFEPTPSEIEEVEIAFRNYIVSNKPDSLTFGIHHKNVPKPDKLVYYKRRYFGRINIENEKVIKVEYIFNRCITPEDHDQERWKDLLYLEKVDSMCWFSFQYNMSRNEIY